jgi:hypothetical protein
VQRARSSGAIAVRGNHDEKVLRWWRIARERGAKKAFKQLHLGEHHVKAVRQMSEEDFTYLESLPFLVPLPDHNALVVHAGLDARASLGAQDPHMMMNIRSIESDGTPTRKLSGVGWASLWRGPEHVLFGHDARRGLQIHPLATGLDSGCCYGRALTAMVLDQGERIPTDETARRARLVQQPAAAAYCPMGDGNGPE